MYTGKNKSIKLLKGEAAYEAGKSCPADKPFCPYITSYERVMWQRGFDEAHRPDA